MNQVEELIINLPNDLLELFSLSLLSYFCMMTSGARLESWLDILLIPERMKFALEDLTRGRLTKLPMIFRQAIF